MSKLMSKERKVLIGDIHGCYHTLMKLLKKISYNPREDKIIFLGDYIDRGKNSFEVVNYLVELQRSVGVERCICLQGNHEQLSFSDFQLWKLAGGTKTIQSYYRNGVKKDRFSIWFRSLPIYHEEDDFVACHAGMPHVKIADNTIDDMLWNGSWVNTMSEPNEKLVICGHSACDGKAYVTMNNNICIDAGCVYGYNLCALVIHKDGQKEYFYEAKSDLD